jgi:thiosulfate dehydrogenase [quinone] large subunit
VSRRQRGSRRPPARPPTGVVTTSWAGPPPSPDAPGPSLREQLERGGGPARALLPLRFFFGATFVYAGFDKLLDPTFFDASNPASIYGQLTAFTHTSPLAPLVHVVQPFAFPIGLLIALAEVAIGLGAVTGLAFRLAAAGGAALSLLFWLTASWTTTPYFYGPDLPYLLGWITLTLAGDGGLLVPTSVRELGAYVVDDWPGTLRSGTGYRVRGRSMEVEASPMRRTLIQATALGAIAFVVASFAVPLRILRPASADGSALGGGGDTGFGSGDGSGGLGSGAGPGASPGGSADPGQAGGSGSTTGSGATPTPAGRTGGKLTLASIGTVDQRGAARARIPLDAPAPYPAGDPAIIVRLSDGSFVAYDATCTHQGCPVGWNAQYQVLLCPCHGAAFDPANHGAVLGGPTRQPLLELPLVVDKQAGTISLRA